MLNEGDVFEIGQSKCYVIDVSGHTKGHIAFYFKDENVIFCGDTLFHWDVEGFLRVLQVKWLNRCQK